MKRSVFIIITILFISSSVWAKYHLTENDMDRVKAYKQMVSEVEKKNVSQLASDIQKMDYPEIQLEIKEAMAKAYVDIVKEENVQGQRKKEWLYSMVALNMAYMQFAGAKDSGAQNLNKLIRYKLKMYLPQDIYRKPGFHCSID